MAEFAALSIAASILQVIDIGVRVVERLNDSRKKGGELPSTFKHISTRLPVFIDALRETKGSLEHMTDSARKAITPAIEECLVQVRKLEATIEKALPKANESGTMRGWKAIISVRYDNEVKEMDEVIRQYMEVMAQHRQLSRINPTVGGQKKPPKPCSTCPFEREPNFIERDVMGQVMEKCQPGIRLALMGIGGVGKSRIAIEYAYRVREISPQTWIFWVSAKDISAVEVDFRKIAKAICIPHWDEKDTDIFTSVREWLRDESNGPWVMIVDNLDDTRVLTATPANLTPPVDNENTMPLPQIREFITTSSNGSILATSRNRDAAQMITGNCAHHLNVTEMNEAEALGLLESKLSGEVLYTRSDAAELVKTVDFMPLAISQIAANISLNYPRLTILKAIEEMKSPNPESVQLLETSMHETSRDVHRSNSIIKTWHLSFQYVRETNPSAARLLSLMCLFDRQGIPEALLRGQYMEETNVTVGHRQKSLTWWKPIRQKQLNFGRSNHYGKKRPNSTFNSKKNTFDDDWRILTDFALIKTNIDGRHFNMHRLVQHTTKRYLEIMGELRVWTRKYVGLMKKCFPTRPEYDNWRVCEYLFPHAHQAAAYKPPNDEALSTWAPLISSIAIYAHDMGNSMAAEPLSRAVFVLFKCSLGEEHVQTLQSAQQLGETLERSKRHKEAETMYKWTLCGRQKVLGIDNNDTLRTLNCLGRVLQTQGKMEEGDEIYKQRLDAKERMLGAHDWSTQLSAHWTAFEFLGRGMFREAENMHRHIYEQAIVAYGAESENTLFQMNILASTLKLQGKLREAEALCRRILDSRQSGPNDGRASMFKSMVNLGEVLEMQQQFNDAEVLYQDAMDGFQELFSSEDENTLYAQERLALVLAQQRKFAEAEVLARNTVNTRERILGKKDRDTLIGIHTLAEVLNHQQKYAEALPLFERAYMETRQLLGIDHPDTKEFLSDYKQVKSKHGELMEHLEREGREKNEAGPWLAPSLVSSGISSQSVEIPLR